MARRSAPPHSGPSYLPPSSQSLGLRHSVDPNESPFQKFLREQARETPFSPQSRLLTSNEQIFAPEKLAGNLSIMTGVTMFLGGIVAVRMWGEALVGDI